MWEGWKAAISQHKAVQDGYVKSLESLVQDADCIFNGQNATWSKRHLEHIAKFHSSAAPGDNKAVPDGYIKRPESIEEARAMAILGTNYLQEFAPDQLVSDNKALVENTPLEGCASCHGSGYYCIGHSGSESDGNAPILERCECYIENLSADTIKQDAPNTPSDGEAS